MQIGYRV